MSESTLKQPAAEARILSRHFKELPANICGYHSYETGSYRFSRDEYFARISWPGGSHVMPLDYFMRALRCDIITEFFYGTVNFDTVFGTLNHYGEVTIFAGLFNEAYQKTGRVFTEHFASSSLMEFFIKMVKDWTNEGYDPFAAPTETGGPWGRKHGSNDAAAIRKREMANRIIGIKGDASRRTDANGHPVNRMFDDVPQDEPLIETEPGFEDEVHAFNLFAYLSRSPVTWNPSVSTVLRDSLFCPTSEEFIMPIIHGNDRCE